MIDAEFPLYGPLALVHRAHVGALLSAMARRADTTMRGAPDPENWFGYNVDNGVAIIPMRGALITDGAFAGARWGFTSFEGLRSELRRAGGDPKVARVVLAVNSPGGMVAGIEGAAAAINDLKAKKPVTAMVEGMAASAAYWLASQANEIVMSSLSEVGSIGVVAMHVDMSGALEQAGLSVSLISSGRHKVDGNPYEPLSAAVVADIQADSDRLRLEFARAVAAGRGARFGSDAALATEARMFPAEEAVVAGLADRIGSLDDIVDPRFGAAAQLRTQAARGSAAVSERARIEAILYCDAARGNEASARKLAFSTDMSADEARAFLAGLPKASSGGPIAAGAVAAGAASWDAIAEQCNTTVFRSRAHR